MVENIDVADLMEVVNSTGFISDDIVIHVLTVVIYITIVIVGMIPISLILSSLIRFSCQLFRRPK